MKPLLLAFLLSVFLAGCGSTGTGSPSQPSDEPELPLVLTTVVDGASLPDPIHAARQLLAQVRQLPQEEIRIVGYTPTLWPDSCLGLDFLGDRCAATVTPGYLVVLESGGQEYAYRTDENGRVELGEAPEVEVLGPIVSWEGRATSPCTRARFDLQSVAFGTCGGPQIAGGYPLPERQADLGRFAGLYAPFEAETPAGRITFVGTGSRTATPAEARMIAEWARLAVQESAAGRSGASWGLALSWNRADRSTCANLTVDLTGWVFASDCLGNAPRLLGQRRLVSEELERLYEMVDKLAPFEESRYGSATATLLFSGTGREQPSNDDILSLMETGAYLFETLGGRDG